MNLSCSLPSLSFAVINKLFSSGINTRILSFPFPTSHHSHHFPVPALLFQPLLPFALVTPSSTLPKLPPAGTKRSNKSHWYKSCCWSSSSRSLPSSVPLFPFKTSHKVQSFSSFKKFPTSQKMKQFLILFFVAFGKRTD